jgi:hypothetical protein
MLSDLGLALFISCQCMTTVKNRVQQRETFYFLLFCWLLLPTKLNDEQLSQTGNRRRPKAICSPAKDFEYSRTESALRPEAIRSVTWTNVRAGVLETKWHSCARDRAGESLMPSAGIQKEMTKTDARPAHGICRMRPPCNTAGRPRRG